LQLSPSYLSGNFLGLAPQVADMSGKSLKDVGSLLENAAEDSLLHDVMAVDDVINLIGDLTLVLDGSC